MEFVDLYGEWQLTENFANSLPAECRDFRAEVSQNQLKYFSGAQVITITSKIAKRRETFTFLVSDVEVNDEPDCQGNSPEESQRLWGTLQMWRDQGGYIEVLAPRKILELEKP